MTKIPADELLVLNWIRNCRVLELGNKKNSTGLYRTWYEARGCDYTCIDWNGMDQALKIDMRMDLDLDLEMGLGKFDVVTNLGFTEHVTEQEPVWRNIDWLCRVGGVMVHCLPYPFPGYERARVNWETHGFWQPTVEWMLKLAETNEYDVRFVGEYADRVRPTLLASFQKTTDRFTWIDYPMHRTKRTMTEADKEGPTG